MKLSAVAVAVAVAVALAHELRPCFTDSLTRHGVTLSHSGPLRQSAHTTLGRGTVLLVERLLSEARQRGVCEE